MTYSAPLEDQLFALDTMSDAARRADALEMAPALLEEAGRFAAGVFAPLNRPGDLEGVRLENGVAMLPAGFREACAQYAAGGWAGLNAPETHGGQGLPFALACAVTEQVSSANMALSVGLMLNQGAIEALVASASEGQKAAWLPRLISGEWWATMNLTEPQAGTDVGAIRTTATPAPDGSWRIRGQKIFISWGEHDCADNILHLVLARTPGAPAGTRGISMFLVPKYLPDAEGRHRIRNDVKCLAVEHKLGIRASPTCSLAFGDEGDCVGWLIGAEHGGMATMFLMMNRTRVNTGIQGTGLAERALQAAVDYAQVRVQSALTPGGASVPIAEHPDVRRMLTTMKARVEAARALMMFTAAAIDGAHRDPDPEQRARARGRADLLTPMAKVVGSETGVDVSSLAIQVFGGAGFIEETGVAQHYRDARIAPIYEGTNGVQAMDLVGRKLRQDGGIHVSALIDEIDAFCVRADESVASPLLIHIRRALGLLRLSTEQITSRDMAPGDLGARATPYLKLFALVVCGYLMARQWEAATSRAANSGGASSHLRDKLVTTRFFIEQILPETEACAGPALSVAADLLHWKAA